MRYINILGINFIDGSFSEIFTEIKKGGVMVVPAAPALATYKQDKSYYKALTQSKFAIFDSGYLTLLLLLIKRINVKKISGLLFLRKFFDQIKISKDFEIFTIDPTDKESKLNKDYLASINIDIKDNQYVAPIYGEGDIEDKELLSILIEMKPKFIIINLGGGVQEKLGVYLDQHLKLEYSPSIICTGAAIAFLTNAQARIPSIVDKLSLGWLARCISDPAKFVPRYLSGFKLFGIVWGSKVERL